MRLTFCGTRCASLVFGLLFAIHLPSAMAWQQPDIEISDEVVVDESADDEQAPEESESTEESKSDEQASPAEANATEPADTTPAVAINGLTLPTAVAIQVESNAIFVADSGAGRVVRVAGDTLQDVITGFPVVASTLVANHPVGPLGLAFADKDHLVVSRGGSPAGEDLISVYKLPEMDTETLTADKAETQLGPVVAMENMPAEGDFFGVTLTEHGLFATSRGDDQKCWIVRATRGTSWGNLERFIPTRELTGRLHPMGMTTSPRGEVVVGQMGESETPGDSMLTFYAPRTGRMLLNLETGLHDIVALAYSTKTNLLYALDAAWAAPDQGGLYRLDDARIDGIRGCKATRIYSCVRPTAMAFAPSGDLYITCAGDLSEPGSAKGALIRVPAGL